MKRRILRKNKKRRDPRYFLHEDLGIVGDEPTTDVNNPAPLASHDEPTPHTTTTLPASDDEKKGAEWMHDVVSGVLSKHGHTEASTHLANKLKELHYKKPEKTEEQV